MAEDHVSTSFSMNRSTHRHIPSLWIDLKELLHQLKLCWKPIFPNIFEISMPQISIKITGSIHSEEMVAGECFFDALVDELDSRDVLPFHIILCGD